MNPTLRCVSNAPNTQRSCTGLAWRLRVRFGAESTLSSIWVNYLPVPLLPAHRIYHHRSPVFHYTARVQNLNNLRQYYLKFPMSLQYAFVGLQDGEGKELPQTP